MSANGTADLPISKELLDILRCPLAVQDKDKYGNDPGRLELVHNSWLVSADSGLKYPIRDGIPIMLIDEGMKWKDTAVSALPVPPPEAAPAGGSHTDSSNAVATSGGGLSPAMIAGAIFALLAVFFLMRRKS